LKKAQAVFQKTSRKNVTSTVVMFSSFLSFWWKSFVEKSQLTQKNCTKMEKEETHAHRKRGRSALSRERTLELRQWCTTSRQCSVRLDRVVEVKRRKKDRRKTRPYCLYVYMIPNENIIEVITENIVVPRSILATLKLSFVL
jgi:hypothetical protein